MKQVKELPSLDFPQAFKLATGRILQIEGRSRRSEYWWMMLVVFLGSMVMPPVGFILDLLIIPLTIRRLHDTGKSGWWWGVGVIWKVAIVVMVIIDLTMVATNQYAFHGGASRIIFGEMAKYLVLVIGLLVYQIVLLVFLCQDSDLEANAYGESPKYCAEQEEEGRPAAAAEENGGE